MTEQEALAKWCPFARVAGQVGVAGEGDSGAYNRLQVDDQPSDFARCLGSGCMAWQWTQCNPGMISKDGIETDGFCGLAGGGAP